MDQKNDAARQTSVGSRSAKSEIQFYVHSRFISNRCSHRAMHYNECHTRIIAIHDICYTCLLALWLVALL